MSGRLLKTGDLLRIGCRSLALQASWNFERLQGLGALFVLAPGLRRLHSEQARQEAFARYSRYFNTHPYLASPVLGMILALEEEGRDEEIEILAGDELRQMIMAPYAAIGDALFWGGLRPLAATVALFFALKGSLWAPLVLLLIFNLPHAWFRIVGLRLGYREGIQMLARVQRWRLPDLAIRVKETTVILLGGLCATLVLQVSSGTRMPLLAIFFCLPLLAGLVFLTRKGVSILVQVYILAGVALVLGFLRGG